MEFKKSRAGMIAVIFVASVAVFPALSFGSISKGDEWELVIDGESLDLLPELEEHYWVIDRPPYNPYDKIGLRRLVKSGEEPIGIIFIFPGTWSSAEQIISDDVYCQYLDAIDADEEKIEEITNKLTTRSACHYLALRGFDVYAMDYRTHYVPITYEQEDIEFMKNWGWKMYMEDAELAVDKVKELSGADKIFLAGESFGGMAAMNYASKHWEEDLEGIVLLDGGTGGKSDVSEMLKNMLSIPISIQIPSIPVMGPILKIITHLMGMYALDVAMDMGILSPLISLMVKVEKAIGKVFDLPIEMFIYKIPHYPEVIQYSLEHPLDPPLDPVTGKRLEPKNHPITGEPFKNYLEWVSGLLYEMPMPGMFTNIYEGYNDEEAISSIAITFDRYWPLQIYLEWMADMLRPGYESDSGEWDRDYFNYYAHYSEIDVPLIAFVSGGLGLKLWGEYNPGIKNADVTGYTLPEWGHLDIYSGTYVEEKINEPTYQWLIDHL